MICLIELLIISILVVIGVTLFLDEKKNRGRAKNLITIKSYWNGENRRRVIRHNAALDVNYSVNHHFKPSRSRDISTHGIGLILSEKLERGAAISLEIRVNGLRDPIKAKARVMWCGEAEEYKGKGPKRLFLTGIKFVRFSDSNQEKKLFDYIRSIEKDITDNYA